MTVARLLHHLALACAAYVLSASGTAAGALPDSTLKNRLVGTWTYSKARATQREANVAAHGIFFAERFDADGTGQIFFYREKLCGPVIGSAKFAWDIKAGILISTTAEFPTDRDRIIDITKDEFTFFSTKNRLVEVRSRTSGCTSS